MSHGRTRGPVCTTRRMSEWDAAAQQASAASACRMSCARRLEELTEAFEDTSSVWGWMRRTYEELLDDPTIAREEAAHLAFQRAYGRVVVTVAYHHSDVRESGGENRGDQVEEFLKNIGASQGQSWCAAFVYWCHERAATQLGGVTTVPRKGRAAAMWFASRGLNWRFKVGEDIPRAGDVFVWAHPKYHGHWDKDNATLFEGHTGLVVRYDQTNEVLTTIEGNTDKAGDREGDGVFVRRDRMSQDQLYGFVRLRLRIPHA